MQELRPISLVLRACLFFLMLVILLWIEQKRPLRPVTQSILGRVLANLSIAAIGLLSLRILTYPIVLYVSHLTATERWGILNQFNFPLWASILLAILLLDYTLYLWHYLNHKVPFLWRFHNVHHVDLDLDVTTAVRFHFGELAFSSGFRSIQVILFGIDPFKLILFEMFITTAAQFHHSNIRLPLGAEKILNKLIVTPRMHGIHHSIVRLETDSNYSTFFSFWDRLHKSIKLNIPQEHLIIGVPSFRSLGETRLIPSLLMPFKKQRPWKFSDGTVPKRIPALEEAHQLVP